MSKTYDQGKDEVAKLCQYFATNQPSFLAPGVKEAHVRQSLIDPLFEALGWDVRNASMTAPQYREVIPEDSLDVEGQQKAPDYTFRVGTLPKFYVEAKKCGVSISADPAPAYQLRRYGFSAKLALSILTDFEELGVYDCASRPRPTDKASHARIQYFGFREYPDRWREIWDVFSRESVWSGTFDQYAASKRKRGTSEVDSEFLKDIEGWRDVLARNLALRNSALSADDLNAAVQRIIDRLIFLRMAEDRGLESYGQLLKLCGQPNIYDRFMSGVCRKADQKYNSGLFHFQKETGVADAPDTLTPRLTVDDQALKPILQSLYFEHGCPYHFGVLPVEILGTVYERFLGKVIRLTAGHQAKVEDKPEVRKAGGVYYTPAYIVQYIVQNTIGKQIDGQSPADLAGGKATPPFRVLDMACGSGSFLLGAYQFLLDHCLKWYHTNPSPKHAKAVYQNAKGETCLAIAERKRILTTHIYGVDIDRQAVETTKLSLLLKALEGENDTTLSQQMTLFQERALPNLSDNIKCGNSLIASDFSMVPEDLVRVKAFDWSVQFPDAMKAGGFDAIIGNPPYGALLSESETKYLRDQYQSAEYQIDTYPIFAERAHGLIKNGAFLGVIIPSAWIASKYNVKFRQFLCQSLQPTTIVVAQKDVFKDATVETVVMICQKGLRDISEIKIERWDTSPKKKYILPSKRIIEEPSNIFPIYREPEVDRLIASLSATKRRFGNFAEAVWGVKVYQKGKGKPPQKGPESESRCFHAEKKSRDTHRRLLGGSEVRRYDLNWQGGWVDYGIWLAEPRTPDWFESERVLIREVTEAFAKPPSSVLQAQYSEARIRCSEL
jgi:type I restriction-modification system DNA methylase subunit